MAGKRIYYVYIMSSKAGITYIGVTSDLERRVGEHKAGKRPGFSREHRANRLVYYEEFQYVLDAIAREKQLKSWRREKKLALIQEFNPKWVDLAEDWGK